MNTRLEAHKCGIGVLTREALVSIGSGPNTRGSTPRGVIKYVSMSRYIKKDECRKNDKNKDVVEGWIRQRVQVGVDGAARSMLAERWAGLGGLGGEGGRI